MNRQIISCILVASFLLYVGCYNMVPITKDELRNREETRTVQLTTKNGESYRITDCSIQSETVSGTLAELNGHVATGIVELPLSEISTVEVRELDGVKTALAVGGGALVAAGFFVVVSALVEKIGKDLKGFKIPKIP